MVTLPSVVKPLLKHGGCFPESRRQKLLGLLKVTPTAFCGLSHKSLPDSRRGKQTPPGQGRSLKCRRREMEGVLFGDPMPAYLTQSPSKYHPWPLGYSLGAIRSLCQSLSLRGEARREGWGGGLLASSSRRESWCSNSTILHPGWSFHQGLWGAPGWVGLPLGGQHCEKGRN